MWLAFPQKMIASSENDSFCCHYLSFPQKMTMFFVIFWGSSNNDNLKKWQNSVSKCLFSKIKAKLIFIKFFPFFFTDFVKYQSKLLNLWEFLLIFEMTQIVWFLNKYLSFDYYETFFRNNKKKITDWNNNKRKKFIRNTSKNKITN